MKLENLPVEEIQKIDKLSYHLLCISKQRYDNDWQCTFNAHHYTELFYVISGHGEFLVNDERFDIHPDDMIIINPNVLHTEVKLKETPMEYIVVGIEGLQFTNIDQGVVRKDFSIHSYRDHKEDILYYLNALLKEQELKRQYYEMICQNQLQILVINMLRHASSDLVVVPAKKIAKECRFIEQYIANHYRENITLDLLSEKTFMNKFYMVHAFKQYKGISPINYLIQLRVTKAKELLATTDRSIAQISDDCGFSSQSYFSQVFKKETHMTPNEYRKIVLQ